MTNPISEKLCAEHQQFPRYRRQDEELDQKETRKLPAPSAPMNVARVFVGERYVHEGMLTLHHWRGGWWRWRGPRWVELEQRAMAAEAYRFTERAVYATKEGDVFRTLFFVMTFFSIGLAANFRKLWVEGIGRLAVQQAERAVSPD